MTHKETFPTTLRDLQKELHHHSQCGRNDVEFRLWIFIAQLGRIAQDYTHNPKVNPTARPQHGTPASRCDDAGHAIVQLLTQIDLLGIDLQDAVDSALVNLREKDFQRRETQETGEIKGVVACFPSPVSPTRNGMAWVIPEGEQLILPPPSQENYSILVMSHPVPDARLRRFHGIVTDQGGYSCHAGIISRENNIPCIVGTGNATKKIQTGDMITLNLLTGIVTPLEV